MKPTKVQNIALPQAQQNIVKRIETKTNVPSSEPGCKGSPVLAGELGAPVVEAAGGWVRRADLRHGQRHAAIERGDEEPPQRHGHRAAVAQAGVVGDGHAHEHGDDGERQGEVGKNACICISSM